MRAVDGRCDAVSSLVGSWHYGTMRDADRDGYEQHLLFCPPCLVQSDKAALALQGLRAAAGTPPPPELLARLTALVEGA